MNTEHQTYGKFETAEGEIVYCPLPADEKNHATVDPEAEDCVEASTMGRYAADITVIDRFLS